MAVERGESGRWKKGQSGNPKGRKPGISEKDLLREAIEKVEKTKNKSLLELFVERAYVEDRVLIALVDRLIPKLTAQEITGAGGGSLRGLFDISPELKEFIDDLVQRTSHKRV
jgi:hypothetical protein